jgi:broad specificity polyphosphatase/5'/3'-nucleotidase SurE
MDDDILGQSLYLQWTNRQTRAINIPTMDEQTDKGNQYTYDGRTKGTRLSTYVRWPETDKGNQYIYDRRRQKRAINIPTMDEKTDKGNQYTYDGRTDRQGQSI